MGSATVAALDGVDLHVGEGEFVVILGASGSGKTTMLNVIGALDQPTSGVVKINGRDITGASRSELFAMRRDTVSFVFQSFNLFAGLTALENVEFGIDISGNGTDGGPRSYLEAVGLGIVPITSRTSYRAGNSNESLSPAHWQRKTRSC